MMLYRTHMRMPPAVAALPRRPSWRFSLLALLGLLVSTPLERALAHGSLKSSIPAANERLVVVPRQLRLVFTEPPELALSRVELQGPGGAVIKLSPLSVATDARRALLADIQETLTPGRYTVAWQIAGDDGHPVRGRFTFTVAEGAQEPTPPTPEVSTPGVPGGTPSTARAPVTQPETHHDTASMPAGGSFDAESPAYVAIRALWYLGLLMAIGTVAFQAAVLPLVRRKRGADGSMLTDARQGAARIGMAGSVIVGIAALLRLGAQFVAMHPAGAPFDPQLVRAIVMDTLWGWAWLLQVVATVVAMTGFRAALRGRGGWRLASIAIVALAVTPALSGHAASTPDRTTLAIVADVLHVIGAGGWLGGLLLVLAAGLPAALRLPDDERWASVADLFNAFSPTALFFAGMVASTGVFAAWLHVQEVSALWQSSYGQTLLVKLAVLSVVALTGAYNWLRVKPALGTAAGTARIQRSARAELLVAVLVIIVTAALVATPPPVDMPTMSQES
jgi:putative copper export protein/methionine-rich copper-binding protein CopC